MATLSFEGHAKGSIDQVTVDIEQVVIAPDYRSIPPDHLAQGDPLEVETPPTAAHVALIGAADRLWVTLGVDHGGRIGVAHIAWRFEEVERHWGRLILCGVPLAGLRAPRDVIVSWQGDKRLSVGVALFCEAVPVRLNIELADFVLRRTIKHSYHAARKPIAP
jgi:hypothetical protein